MRVAQLVREQQIEIQARERLEQELRAPASSSTIVAK